MVSTSTTDTPAVAVTDPENRGLKVENADSAALKAGVVAVTDPENRGLKGRYNGSGNLQGQMLQ